MTEPLEAAKRADEEEYQAQLLHKISKVKELFKVFQLPELEVHQSERSHYRMRCVLANGGFVAVLPLCMLPRNGHQPA